MKLLWRPVGSPKALPLALACAAIAVMPVDASEIATKVDWGTAQRLAAESFPTVKEQEHFQNAGVEGRFMIFTPLGGEDATAPLTALAINPWTGDVWEMWQCKRLSTPALRKSQAAIRKRFNRDEFRQYKNLRALKPICYGP
jgi:hypothetical protein